MMPRPVRVAASLDHLVVGATGVWVVGSWQALNLRARPRARPPGAAIILSG
jgi:hypothetical protein